MPTITGHVSSDATIRLPYFFEGMLYPATPFDRPWRAPEVQVTLHAPDGTEQVVPAFWDGGQTWRFRVDAAQAGRWSYQVHAAGHDAGDGGGEWLGGSGEFQVQPYAGANPLYRHGPVGVAAAGSHLAHADGTPFLWLADTTWNGVLAAAGDQWRRFLQRRREQGFTAVQCVMTHWRAFPADAHGERAVQESRSGDGSELQVNPAFFRRLDRKVAAIAGAGLVPVLVLLWALTDWDPGRQLSEADAVALARYIVARYAAFRPAWFLGGDGRYDDDPERWRRVGRAVFPERSSSSSSPGASSGASPELPRRLTTLHPAGHRWIGELFRAEPWFDFIGYQSGHSGDEARSFDWIVGGEPSSAWSNQPPLPSINLEPCYEGHRRVGTAARFDAYDVRVAMYHSLLGAPVAGVSYGHNSIWSWAQHEATPMDHGNAGVTPPWHTVVESPGAGSVSCLKHLLDGLPWWLLRPAPRLAGASATGVARTHVSVAASDAGDLVVAYLPRGGEIPEGIPTSGRRLRWYDPRAGSWHNATTSSAPAPDAATDAGNDWVLVVDRPPR